jgi:anaerobic magnesium-protoporphyrin IX monomethyl ester cyclase
MKLCLVNAAPPGASRNEQTLFQGTLPPLGILYISSFLKEKGYDVSVLDQGALDMEADQALAWIEQEDPGVLGFYTVTWNSKIACNLAELSQERNPSLKIVMGGYHATYNSERILRKYPFVDAVVRWEGEKTMLEVMQCFETGTTLSSVEGISFRDGDRIHTTPQRPPIQSLDELPFPDRDALSHPYKIQIPEIDLVVKKGTSMITSSGCSFKCRFCAAKKIGRQTWRPRSVDSIVAELETLIQKGYDHIYLADDNFILDPKRVKDICAAIKKKKLTFRWSCDGRVDNASRDVFEAMAETGCQCIFFGMESASQHVLDYYRKHITPQQTRRAVKVARAAGIDYIVGSFIIGAPHESLEDVYNTFRFITELRLNLAEVSILGASPGMEIWDEIVSKKYINEEEKWEDGIVVPEVCPECVPLEKLEELLDAFRASPEPTKYYIP